MASFERAHFGFAWSESLVLTTPNRDYNVTWESVGAGGLHHPDRRFEWGRQELQTWAEVFGGRFGDKGRFLPLGPVGETLGPPT